MILYPEYVGICVSQERHSFFFDRQKAKGRICNFPYRGMTGDNNMQAIQMISIWMD